MTLTEKNFRSNFVNSAIQVNQRPEFKPFILSDLLDFNDINDNNEYFFSAIETFDSLKENDSVWFSKRSTVPLSLLTEILEILSGSNGKLIFGKEVFKLAIFPEDIFDSSKTEHGLYVPYCNIEYNKEKDQIDIIFYLSILIHYNSFNKHELKFLKYNISIYIEEFTPENNEIIYFKNNEFIDYNEDKEDFIGDLLVCIPIEDSLKTGVLEKIDSVYNQYVQSSVEELLSDDD